MDIKQKIQEDAYAGDAFSQGLLGEMYANGEGIPQDNKEAIKWFVKAAEQGDENARTCLFKMHATGKNLPDDYCEALKWFANQGYSWAQTLIGRVYAQGEGVVQDIKEAVRWWTMAAEQGDIRAKFCIGLLYLNEYCTLNGKNAIKWIKESAQGGESEAQFCLGVIYAEGKRVDRDYNEAFRWWIKAAEQKYEPARNILYNGIHKDDRTRDYKKVVKWYAKQGWDWARVQLKLL